MYRVADGGAVDSFRMKWPAAAPGAKGIILSILSDIVQSRDDDDLRNWFDHIGFDVGAISHPSQLQASYLGFYSDANGKPDADRATHDLATWPPIAQRIVELMAERARKTAT